MCRWGLTLCQCAKEGFEEKKKKQCETFIIIIGIRPPPQHALTAHPHSYGLPRAQQKAERGGGQVGRVCDECLIVFARAKMCGSTRGVLVFGEPRQDVEGIKQEIDPRV